MVKWYIQYTGIVNGILIYYNAIMNIVNIVNPTIWVNFITAEPCPPEPWVNLDIGESSPNGRKIQVSEIL